MTLAWPDTERFVPQKLFRGVYAAQTLTDLCGAAGTVLQAGGCLGLWPLAFASLGWRVLTCEPATENLAYLRSNIRAYPNVEVHPVALGAAPGRAALTRPKPGAGLWTVTEGDEVTVTTVDRLCADLSIHALVLDVEGSELPALAGAEQTITRDRPVIWLERRLHVDQIDQWFHDHDYSAPVTVDRWDVYAVPLDEVAKTW